MEDLTVLRQAINQIDGELYALFIRRLAISRDIARYKQAHGLPILDEKREREKLNSIAAAYPAPLVPHVQGFYTALAALSKNYQKACQEDTPACTD